MGKWTPDRYDDVLGAKIKGLVVGAIKRSKLEKVEPTISYETFVDDLDTGDSFTTSLIDILVKELAERRLRQGSADRRLIADRTAKNLRMLATPLRVYQERPGRRLTSRRSVNLTDYLSAPPDEMEMDDEEDDFESMLDNGASSFEGARINTELYDAYGTHAQSWLHPSMTSPITRRAHPSYLAATSTAPPESGAADPLPVSHSPPATSRGPWSLPPVASYVGSSGLSRQPSVRRAIRARAVDFNDFTRQRRYMIRQNAQEAGGSRSEGSEDINTGPLPTPARSPMPEETSTLPGVRRFFPFSTRARRHETWSPSTLVEPPENGETEEPTPSGATENGSSRPWFLIPGGISSAPTSQLPSGSLRDSEARDERLLNGAPRLRRGGLRAPESMLSRHASPSIGVTAPVTVPTAAAVHAEPAEPADQVDSLSTDAPRPVEDIHDDTVIANQLSTPSSDNVDEHESNAGT